MTLYYTGVGARKTPHHILKHMTEMAQHLANVTVVRTGDALGADTAFRNGSHGYARVYKPNDHICKKAFKMVDLFHPAPERLTPFTRRLMARNSYQVLGDDLKTPSLFVLCWTPQGKGGGGTGQAIRIARHYFIPVFDLGNMSVEAVKLEISTIVNEELNFEISAIINEELNK